MSNIGVDRWVAESEDRDTRYAGWTGPARRLLDRVPRGWKLGAFLAVAAVYPLLVQQAGHDFGRGQDHQFARIELPRRTHDRRGRARVSLRA